MSKKQYLIKNVNEKWTAEEIKWAKKQVFLYTDGVIWYEEVLEQTRASIDLFFDEVEDLSCTLDQYCFVVDLSNTKRPNALLMRTLNERIGKIKDKMDRAILLTGKNQLMNTILRFMIQLFGVQSVTIVDSKEEVIRHITAYISNDEK